MRVFVQLDDLSGWHWAALLFHRLLLLLGGNARLGVDFFLAGLALSLARRTLFPFLVDLLGLFGAAGGDVLVLVLVVVDLEHDGAVLHEGDLAGH